jgi:pyruvate formate lyase activating enzyme
MQISGFQPFTLSDFPGRPAAIVFTQGCNMACPFCHNGDLIARRSGKLSERDILAILRRRCGLLQGIVITGGEPTLQPDLDDFCRTIHTLGLLVKLDTNGSNPDKLEFLIEAGLVDYIAMDIKAPLDDPSTHHQLTGSRLDPGRIARSMHIIADSGIEHHFRTTVVPGLLDDANLVRIAASIPDGSRHVRQTFRPEHALDRRLRDMPQVPTIEAIRG